MLTDQQINEKIFELLGWSRNPDGKRWDTPYSRAKFVWKSGDKLNPYFTNLVPNFCGDLSLITDAVPRLVDTMGGLMAYRFWVSAASRGMDTSGGYVPNYKPANDSVTDWLAEHSAPARIRAEALLRALNKYD